MIIDFNQFIDEWLDFPILNDAYKYFYTYNTNSHENISYFPDPTILKDRKYDEHLFLVCQCFDNLDFQQCINELTLTPHDYMRHYYTNITMRWGYEYKYQEASENLLMLYFNRFNDKIFKLIWLILILNDLDKFSNVFINEVSLWSMIEELKEELADNKVILPYLHLKSKRQFIYHFDKSIKNTYNISSLQSLLDFLKWFTIDYLLNYKFMVIVVGKSTQIKQDNTL